MFENLKISPSKLTTTQQDIFSTQQQQQHQQQQQQLAFQEEEIPLVETHLFHDFVVGALLGITHSFAGQPFDAIRLNSQTGNISRVAAKCNTRSVAKHIYNSDGLKGFFSGWYSPAVGFTLGRACQQSAMNLMKDYFILKQRAEFEEKELKRLQRERELAEANESLLPWYTSPIRAVNSKFLMEMTGVEEKPLILSQLRGADDFGGRIQNDMNLPLWKNILCATVGSIVYTTTYTPFDLVRVRMLTQNQYPHRLYHHSLDCAYKLYECGGMRKLYLGYQAAVIRDIPAQILIFGSYGVFRNLLPQDPTNHQLHQIYHATALGAACGAIQWSFVIPLDRIKTVIQVSPEQMSLKPSWRQAARFIYLQDGFRGFYAGLPAAICKASLSYATLFTVMEFTSKQVATYQKIHKMERLTN